MGKQVGTHTIRIAVKDAVTNQRMLETLGEIAQENDFVRKAAF